MTTRDLTVLLLLIFMSVVVGTIDTLLDFTPEQNDGLLSAALVFTTSWFAYKLGKGKPDGK